MAGGDTIIIGAPNPVENKAIPLPTTHETLQEKIRETPQGPEVDKTEALEAEITAAPAVRFDSDEHDEKETDDEGAVIRTATDAAEHLLSLRDDGQPALTFRGILLATILSGFQAVVYQIYQVSYARVLSIRACSRQEANTRHDSSNQH
jgi:hypothetical protein